MCGIAGIINSNKLSLRIEDVLTSIKHRGPDGLFYWKAEGISLGHARLSIIDLTTNANQPMIDHSSGNVIVFNGEIYNYLEIKKMIGAAYNFKTHSDTEVILAAYSVYGLKGLEYLQGMFAFALYDKVKNKVLCVRDRLGIKPFYYRKLNAVFIFASEIKAVINRTDKKEEINQYKVYEFLADRQLDTNEQTFFEGVLQLPAGNYMWVDLAGNTEAPVKYWDYPVLGNRRFDENAKAEFVDIFDKTIAFHLRSDVAVGSFLSGGLDSSSVSCFALRNMEQSQLHTFSGVLPYHHPENALIDDVLKSSERFIPHKFMLDGNSFFDDIGDVIYHHDEPVLDGSMYAHYKLCQLANQNGIKVLLSGSGGDELFGGYSSHVYAHHAALLSGGRLAKYFGDIHKVSKNSADTFTNLIVKSIYENIPLAIRKKIKNKQLRGRNQHLEIHPFIDHYHYDHKNKYYANLLNNYKSWTVPPYLHYEDRNSMAFGVEIRVPFYDHKLMDFVFQFSPDQIISGSTKSILRSSFKGIVPEKVLTQKGKYGFPSPIDHALVTNKTGKEFFFDMVGKTPFLKKKETEKIGIDFYAGNGNLTTYWRLLSYMIWYDIFFTKK